MPKKALPENPSGGELRARLQRLESEARVMRAALEAFVEWHRKVSDETQERFGSVAGENYLNGESDTHPGDGWEDLDVAAAMARRALQAR